MKVGFLRVVENTRLYGHTYIMWFEAGPVTLQPEASSTTDGASGKRGANSTFLSGAASGQFVMLRTADQLAGASGQPSAESLADDPLLPRAMSYHRLRRTGRASG